MLDAKISHFRHMYHLTVHHALIKLTVYHNSLCSMDVPSWQIPALDDRRELTKVSHLGGLLPAHLHRLDQISQVDLCQISQPEPMDVPVIHPLAELHAHQPPVSAAAMTKITQQKESWDCLRCCNNRSTLTLKL